MELIGEELKKSGSRFQVARVENNEEQTLDAAGSSVLAKNEVGDGSVPSHKEVECHGGKVTLVHVPVNKPASDSTPADRNHNATRSPSGQSVQSAAAVIHGPGSHGPESPCATFSISGGDSLPSRGSGEGFNYNSKSNGVMNTIEALPCVEHYRNVFSASGGGYIRARPTLAELHEELDDEEIRGIKKETGGQGCEGQENTPLTGDKTPGQAPIRLGWIKGVLVRCVLNIFGVMLFIRLPWVVGNAGILQASVIVVLSGLVTTITAISMTAICTNGEVKGGGAYYMISRSLGPEFGGAIGIIFSVANAVAVAMYVVGFSETVRDILKRYDLVMVDDMNDIRIIGSITITVLFVIAVLGLDWESRAQIMLLVILTVAIAAFFLGLCVPPSVEQMSQGFLGPKEVFVSNLNCQYEEEQTFFSVFGIFFPAATGFLAGANISGDLKDASKSIPKGTFLAIFITSMVYLLIAVFSGAFILREANGIILVSAVAANASSFLNSSAPVMGTSIDSTPLTTSAGILAEQLNKSSSSFSAPAGKYQPVAPSFSLEDYSYTRDFVSNCSLLPQGCKYGLLHSYQVIEMSSVWGPLILAGIFSATLSSALASLMSAPKVFQALCKDRIFPFLAYFGVGHGPNENPTRAFVLCFVIGLCFNIIADLNAIAPLISNFFLMSYALINFSCFDASLARSPGWRPAFRFYNKWLSLGGALLCITVMFIINWVTALVTFGCVGSLFIYVRHWKPDVNWGSSTQAHVYRSVLQSALKLVRVGEHVKNFRPQILVLTGEPVTRPALVDFCNPLTKKMGLMICGNVLVGDQQEHLRQLRPDSAYAYFRQRRIKSFYSVTTAPSFQHGVQALMQNVGIGKFRPNLLMLGFKSDWQTDAPDKVHQYLGVIHDAFDLKLGVGILRLKNGFGLDVGCDTTFFDPGHDEDQDQSDDESHGIEQIEPDLQAPADKGKALELRKNIHESASKGMLETEDEDEEGATNHVENPHLFSKLNTQVHKKISKLRHKEKGTIDVWWLFDDGGLTLLLPHILTTRTRWRGCKLRVFSAGTRNGDLGYEQRQLATLLAKFRIDCKDMVVLPEINKKPLEASVKQFNALLAPWRLNVHKGETKEEFPWKTTDDELELLKDKTQRHIRLRELLTERSKESSLIIMTLPMPRKGTCPAGLYMCWIDTLTRDMPPILLVRGNQESVLTFYF